MDILQRIRSVFSTARDQLGVGRRRAGEIQEEINRLDHQAPSRAEVEARVAAELELLTFDWGETVVLARPDVVAPPRLAVRWAHLDPILRTIAVVQPERAKSEIMCAIEAQVGQKWGGFGTPLAERPARRRALEAELAAIREQEEALLAEAERLRGDGARTPDTFKTRRPPAHLAAVDTDAKPPIAA